MVELPFSGRIEAGRALGEELVRRGLGPGAVILALPRGGVPVGCEVAKALHAPLDVVVVRKLGVPWQPELAMGAIAGGSFQTLDRELIGELRIPQEDIDQIIEREQKELERREHLYRKGRPALHLQGQTAILVDDGLATGSTMLVAARYVRSLEPARLIIAVPVASVSACVRLRKVADELICLATPDPFRAVGGWYVDFRQVEHSEVQHLLEHQAVPSS